MPNIGSGDEGYTSLLSGERVMKESPRIEALGELDEATSAIGLARSLAARAETGPLLVRVQREMYRLMAEIAARKPDKLRDRLEAEDVERLEAEIAALGETIPIGELFVVPGDSAGGGALHLARTVVRRAERRVAALAHRGLVKNEQLLRYLNRLSYLLYLLARADDRAAGIKTPTPMRETE